MFNITSQVQDKATQQAKEYKFRQMFSDVVARLAIDAIYNAGFTDVVTSNTAPNTFEELQAMAAAQKGKEFIVFSGGSENTIYTTPRCNELFRAWHDILHLQLNAPFNAEGEKIVANAQIAMLPVIYRKTMDIEINGQVEYFAKWGKFPVDQLKFYRLAYVFGVSFACSEEI